MHASLLDDALLDVLAHSAEVDRDVLGALVEQQRYQLVASEWKRDTIIKISQHVALFTRIRNGRFSYSS